MDSYKPPTLPQPGRQCCAENPQVTWPMTAVRANPDLRARCSESHTDGSDRVSALVALWWKCHALLGYGFSDGPDLYFQSRPLILNRQSVLENPPPQNVRWLNSAWLLSKRRPAVRPANTCCCTAVASFTFDNVDVVSSSRTLNATRGALQHASRSK